MLIVCGNCGQKIEIDAATPDGTHVKCPYCNEKTTFSRPKRIEIPGVPRKTPVVRRPELTPTPALSPAPSADYEAALRAKQVAEVEGRVQGAEQRKANAAARDQKQAQRREIVVFTKIVILLVALVVIAGAGWWFWNWQQVKRENARQAAEVAAQRLAEVRRLEAEEQAKRDAERAEEARKAAERRAEKERKRAEEEADRVAREAARTAGRKLFDATEEAFAAGAFHFISALPAAKAPGAREGTFYYLLPRPEKARRSFIVCESSANGTVTCSRLFENGDKESYESAGDFLKGIDGQDYLMLAPDRNLYFHSRRRKDHVGEISKSRIESVVEAFFGGIAKDVMCFIPEFDDLNFEIVFVPRTGGPKAKPNPIIVETVGYGMPYSIDKVRDAIQDAFPDKGTAAKPNKRKRSKRTVVFWDGAMVKHGIDGVTYVPRVCPTESYSGGRRLHVSTTGRAREQWTSLYDEAVRQEELERQTDEVASYEDAQKNADAYSRRLDRIFDEGTLFFRARVKNR